MNSSFEDLQLQWNIMSTKSWHFECLRASNIWPKDKHIEAFQITTSGRQWCTGFNVRNFHSILKGIGKIHSLPISRLSNRVRLCLNYVKNCQSVRKYDKIHNINPHEKAILSNIQREETIANSDANGPKMPRRRNDAEDQGSQKRSP